ncbi:uncharacterized protein EDB91DRAFT_1121233 [Suillus paluster]|uniref:uncharacterized protein n=1 Tax=Suillus paluster TaxID=48578 RepID=UPI001B87215A|nr:uncharacterized protein EDB91DRAFT_1121233 [Suillus paluster]KAG1745496.1 hypothetical protein EDB91DRAFT_1121233 [Suillus paluster]
MSSLLHTRCKFWFTGLITSFGTGSGCTYLIRECMLVILGSYVFFSLSCVVGLVASDFVVFLRAVGKRSFKCWRRTSAVEEVGDEVGPPRSASDEKSLLPTLEDEKPSKCFGMQKSDGKLL